MLVRDAPLGLEVFLQRRTQAMAFAPNMTVFPGGGVDARDGELYPALWTGPAPTWWASRFGCPAGLAGALVGAAVRETLEECGVLFAGPPAPAPPHNTPEAVAAARRQLLEHRAPLADVLAAHGWLLRADLLLPWSNWITPENRPRRYDTRFFVAALPSGQHADDASTEVTRAGWSRPVDALTQWEQGHIELMSPTSVTLRELARCADVPAVLAAASAREITPIRPPASSSASPNERR
jgi:8-oxo-dGTP pyrophosphatase MutT (NUDIX family)